MHVTVDWYKTDIWYNILPVSYYILQLILGSWVGVLQDTFDLWSLFLSFSSSLVSLIILILIAILALYASTIELYLQLKKGVLVANCASFENRFILHIAIYFNASSPLKLSTNHLNLSFFPVSCLIIYYS